MTGFTLAEVLITMAIIGVVAAMTIPTLVQNYKDRQYKIQSTNFQRKFGEALKIMDGQSNLQGLSSTEQFVEELQKHMKITKVCDEDHLMECFEDTIKLADGKDYDISKIKTSADLGHVDYGTNIIGLQFADSTIALVAYNPTYFNTDPTQVVKLSFEKEGKLSIVNLSTGVISIVFDTSGFEKPNHFGTDVKGINSSFGLVSSADLMTIGDYVVYDMQTNYKPTTCVKSSPAFSEKYCKDPDNSNIENDYWAGAIKACDDIGMRLATYTDLLSIYKYAQNNDDVQFTSNTWYWCSNPRGNIYNENTFNLTTGADSAGRRATPLNAMCVL